MSAPNVRSRSTAVGNTPPHPEVEAHELSHYRLSTRLAQDELATIYRGVHLTLDRPVDVYILRRSDWVSASRFQLSARLGARLHHPSILPVIDAGHDARYGDYMITPRLDGRTLEDVLKNGPIEPTQALRIITQIGSALDYLHTQEIVHRDVRPANIVLTEQGIAYLTNFSLASSPDTPDLSSIEDADYLTPYAAPEQSLAKGPASPAQDIYGLGAVLFSMMSGELPPAPGQTPRPLTERNPALAGVDRIIRRMLSVDTAQRFSNAEQAVTALRQILRKQLDDTTVDMEESHWEPVAEWLDNPLELVVGDLIDHDFVIKSRARADGLHRVGAIRRLLDRWSRHGFLRRPALGQLVQPDQVVSYNLYFYALRAYYETRTPPQLREQVHSEGAFSSMAREPDLWEAPVPETEPFTPALAETIVIPGSQQVVPCTACNGATEVTCTTCGGKATIERTRRVKEPDGSTREDKFNEQCPTCRGYGRQPCKRCEGKGHVLREKIFTWSRSTKIHHNEDDISGLHKLTLETQAQQVLQTRIDPYESRWYQIAPLKELLEVAINAGGANSRLINTELTIRGVPVTEVDFRHHNRPHSLALIGFKDELRGDSLLLDIERIALYVAIALLVLVLAGVLLWFR